MAKKPAKMISRSSLLRWIDRMELEMPKFSDHPWQAGDVFYRLREFLAGKKQTKKKGSI